MKPGRRGGLKAAPAAGLLLALALVGCGASTQQVTAPALPSAAAAATAQPSLPAS